jgi:hypothetical protein
MYFLKAVWFHDDVSIDSAISCQIHKPQHFNRECPVHSHRLDYPSHSLFMYYPDCGNDGIGNGLVNNDHHETIPLCLASSVAVVKSDLTFSRVRLLSFLIFNRLII